MTIIFPGNGVCAAAQNVDAAELRNIDIDNQQVNRVRLSRSVLHGRAAVEFCRDGNAVGVEKVKWRYRANEDDRQ